MVMLKLILEELRVGGDFPGRGSIAYEGPESGKSWVFIGNKEKPQSREGKDQWMEGQQ